MPAPCASSRACVERRRCPRSPSQRGSASHLKRTRCRRTFPSWPSTRRRAPVGACRRAWMRRHTENIRKFGGGAPCCVCCVALGRCCRVHCTRSNTVAAFDCALAKKKIATTTCDTPDGSSPLCRLGLRVEVFGVRGSGVKFGVWALGITCDTSDGSLSHCRKMDSTTFSATPTHARPSQGLRCHAIRPCMDTLGKMDAAPLSLPRVGGLGCRVWDCGGG